MSGELSRLIAPAILDAQTLGVDAIMAAMRDLVARTRSGRLRNSEITQGTITKTDCVDVSTQTKEGPITIGGAVSATNIGDSALATVTTVELTTGCVGLRVTAAKFVSPNKDAHAAAVPARDIYRHRCWFW